MQSLPVVIIRCEENEINQLDFRIQTDNIRCFILLSGLRNWQILKNISAFSISLTFAHMICGVVLKMNKFFYQT
jgi:hypothetical protein